MGFHSPNRLNIRPVWARDVGDDDGNVESDALRRPSWQRLSFPLQELHGWSSCNWQPQLQLVLAAVPSTCLVGGPSFLAREPQDVPLSELPMMPRHRQPGARQNGPYYHSVFSKKILH